MKLAMTRIGWGVLSVSCFGALAQTNVGQGMGGAGLDVQMSGPCSTARSEAGASACDVVISPEYTMRDFSRYFDPGRGGNNDAYVVFPTRGGIGRPRFAEDRRGANRYQTSLNAAPLGVSGQYDDRTPFVFEERTSNVQGYADNFGAILIRQRVSGGGHNYILPFASEKANFTSLAMDSVIRSSNQGGGMLGTYLAHTAPGDDMVFSVQHDTNGCSEGEDECNKLFRAFLETTTFRWGGTLKADPLPDAAGFGNYALDVTVGPGYSASQSGEDVFLVNLERLYASGNMTAILESPYQGLARVTGDAAAGWGARFGASAMTTLTAPIDNRSYDGGCPSAVTSAGGRFPDPMITDEAGIGGLSGFCATVGSTAGLVAGESITIAGAHSNIEVTRVVRVVDGTHLTLNAQMYHDVGETLSGGGAQGYGISFVADDIAPGKLLNYYTQPQVTLRKFFPIVGSDAAGGLLVYTNAMQGYEVSTVGYVANQPNVPAVVRGVTMRGTSVTGVTLQNGGDADYHATPKGALGVGQTLLAVPTVTFSGKCLMLPQATASYRQMGRPTGLSVTVTNPGDCTAPPVATVQTVWENPYRIAPLVMTKKVINPATGSVTDGHLLVGALKPADWHAGDHVEIPGWIHDHVGSSVVYGKYYTGSSRSFGVVDTTTFQGDYAWPDTLRGVVNQTDGHKYFATKEMPVGPGVAYERPPYGLAMVGDYTIHLPLWTPPTEAVIDVGCARFGFGSGSYHPCMDGIWTAYNLFQMQAKGGLQALRFDPTMEGKNMLSWSGPLRAQGVVHAGAGVQLESQAGVGCGAGNRGQINYVAGGGGVKDTVQICAKDASEVFAWRTLY